MSKQNERTSAWALFLSIGVFAGVIIAAFVYLLLGKTVVSIGGSFSSGILLGMYADNDLGPTWLRISLCMFAGLLGWALFAWAAR